MLWLGGFIVCINFLMFLIIMGCAANNGQLTQKIKDLERELSAELSAKELALRALFSVTGGAQNGDHIESLFRTNEWLRGCLADLGYAVEETADGFYLRKT